MPSPASVATFCGLEAPKTAQSGNTPDDEPLVMKRRVSAFTGSDLEVLRGLGARHLVLVGIATSGVVLSTVRQATDLTVLADACTDADPEAHRVLTETVFPRQATVTTVAGWSAGLP